MFFGATALLLLGKEGYKSTNNGSATSRTWLVTTCLAFIFMNIIIQVFAQGFLCLLWCVEHDTDNGLDENENRSNMKTIGLKGGDAPEVTELKNMDKFEKGFVFRDVKDAWTMTPKPRIHDIATSPPSPSWYHPPPPPHNTPVDQRDAPNDRKEILRRNRMVSVDPVGAFVGGVRTSASGLDITADDLDMAKKKLRCSFDSTGSTPANTVPKMLPVVFEDIFKEAEDSEKSKAEVQEMISDEYERNKALGSPKGNADQSDKQNGDAPLATHEHSNSDLEEGADDVFLIGTSADDRELPLIEIHAEPQQVQCSSNPQFEELSDSSKRSSTEEDLIANFYGKLDTLKKCGYRPIGQRTLPFASDMCSRPNSIQNSNEEGKLQRESPNTASNLEMTPECPPRLPSSSPPTENLSSNQSVPELFNDISDHCSLNNDIFETDSSQQNEH
jgi:hypothetical protein